jgi:hypothetical protein
MTTIHNEPLHGSGTRIPRASKWLAIAPLIEQAVPVTNVAAKLGCPLS